jgi:N-acetylglucosamine kinase-like BadF-type ATPase
MGTSSDDAVYLGVDGGQTSTKAVLVTPQGLVLARLESSGMVNALAPDGLEKLERALGSIRDQVVALGHRPAAVFLALTAFEAGKRAQVICEEVAEQVWPDIPRQTAGDGMAAWAGGTGGRPGVAAMAGTGSVVEAINERGDWAETGGWGYLLGDNGSGWDIGSSAVRIMLQRWDRREDPTPLDAAILAAFSASRPSDVADALYSGAADYVDIAKIAEFVADAARGRDETARDILRQSAARFAVDVADAVGRLAWEHEPVTVATLGRVFLSGDPYRASFVEVLERISPRPVRVTEPVLSTLGGAGLMAIRLGGFPIDDGVLARLAEGT